MVEKIPLFAMSAGFGALTVFAQRATGAMTATQEVPLSFRSANAAISYIRYIGKIFYPKNLAALYPYPQHPWLRWQIAASVLILAAVTICVLYATRKQYLAVGWLWFIGTLVPVVGLVQVGAQAMADRFTYLPSIGIYIVVVWAGAEFAGKIRWRKILLAASAALLLVMMLAYTRTQLRHWKDELALYGHAAEVTENNYVMHGNYAVVLQDAGRLDEAINHHKQALQISPTNYRPLHNLAKAYYMQGKPDLAIASWYKLLEHNKNWFEPTNNLAWLLATSSEPNLQNPADAVRLAEKACELTAFKNPQAIDTLAVAYAAAGRFTEAADIAEKAIELALSQKDDTLATQVQNRLELYKNSEPYRE